MTTKPEALRDAFAPSGRLRAAINVGNPVLAQRGAAVGAPSGASVDLARELGRRIGADVDLVPFETAGESLAAVLADSCDIGFFAIDPARSAGIVFSAPYVLIEGTYMVPAGSNLHRVEDVDAAGVRISAGLNAAYDLYLTRAIKHATLVHAPTSHQAMQMFLDDRLEAAAGVRQALEAFAREHGGLRILEGAFMTIRQAMAVGEHRSGAAAYLRSFVEEMKASGFVADALARSGQAATVAPPA